MRFNGIKAITVKQDYLKHDGWEEITTKFPVNMKASLDSGQPLAFHSVYNIDGSIAHVSYVTGRGAIELEYVEGAPSTVLHYKYHGDYTASSAKKEIMRRFGLGDNMAEVYKNISTDSHIKSAIERHYGLRVTHNEPWETTLCFVISQFNNIKRIKGIVRNLINAYGPEMDTGDRLTRLFPDAETLSKASIADLRTAGTGFRAKYIKNIASACAEGFDLDGVRSMDYGEAKSYLMDMDGVGDKVADCILLMGYKQWSAFPIDVWVKRSMEKLYFNSRKKSIEDIHEFADGRWGDYAGYAQQYLFHNARKAGLR